MRRKESPLIAVTMYGTLESHESTIRKRNYHRRVRKYKNINEEKKLESMEVAQKRTCAIERHVEENERFGDYHLGVQTHAM